MSDTSQAQEDRTWRPKANPWLIAVVVALAAFMEVLDTSIANVALPYMAGSLGATHRPEHLGAHVVPRLERHRPAHQRLVRQRARPQAVLHDLSRHLHGELAALRHRADSGVLLVFRVLQGAGGGGLQPMAQAILADTFPPQQRGLAFALFGITAVVAPILGPTLGGWITDNYTWRWIFLINLPVGIVASFLVFRLVEDPPWQQRLASRRGEDRLHRRSRCSSSAWARCKSCSTRDRSRIGSPRGSS